MARQLQVSAVEETDHEDSKLLWAPNKDCAHLESITGSSGGISRVRTVGTSVLAISAKR
jgi:hypothetical protein